MGGRTDHIVARVVAVAVVGGDPREGRQRAGRGVLVKPACGVGRAAAARVSALERSGVGGRSGTGVARATSCDARHALHI